MIELEGLSYALCAIITAYSGLSIMQNYTNTKKMPVGQMECRGEVRLLTCGVLLIIIVITTIILKIISTETTQHLPLDNNAMALGGCWSCYIADRKVKRTVMDKNEC